MFIPGFGLNVGPGGPALASVMTQLPNLSSDLTVQHFSQFDGFMLQANTFYWIDLTISGQSNEDHAAIGWGVTNDDFGPGVSEGYNSSGITDFSFFPNKPTPPPNNGGPIFQMEINAAAAPEPSTWCLMLMGFAGLGPRRPSPPDWQAGIATPGIWGLLAEIRPCPKAEFNRISTRFQTETFCFASSARTLGATIVPRSSIERNIASCGWAPTAICMR